MNPLVILIVAAVVTVLLIPILERRALALRVLDEPGPRKVHERPMPRVGGIAMAVGAAIPVLLWVPMDRSLAAVLLAALTILVFGVWDDRRNLPARTKFLGQCIAVAIVMFAGGVSIHSVTLAERFEIPSVISIPLTFFFLIGTTNAINLADGLDGLAGGTTFLCMAAIAVLSGGGAPVIMALTLAMMGSLLGFLRYNSYPARVFMGDGGSQLLGFMAGVLAVQLTQEPDLPYSAALPLLLLGLPIIDTLTVMILRVYEGRSPFAADRKHLHHRFLELGFDHFEAVAIIYVLQGVLFVLAWQMRYQSDLLVVLVFAAFGTAVLLSLFVALQSGWRWPGVGGVRLAEVMQRRVPWLKAPAHVPRWGNVIAWAAVTVYLVAVSVTSTSISRDVAWLALALAGLLLTVLLRLLPLKVVGGLVHGAVFVAMAMAVYLDHFELSKLAPFTGLKRLLFPVLAIAVVLRLRFWRERRFEITPLDVLVVLLAIVLPNLPGLEGAPSNVGFSVAKLVVLMYAAEMLIRHSDRTRGWLWASTAIALLVVGLRGLVPGAG
jgi:UDP-GlcNAc:undecaprenyl-phosphate/decaprenyl-phosphate GlcNAc-1-phosphate transferase